MKYLLLIITGLSLMSCGTRIPFTDQVKEDFALETAQSMKKVQFYVSGTINLVASTESGGKGTNDDGTLVSNSSKTEDDVIIPIGTPCVFDSFNDDGSINIKFQGGTLSFKKREGQTSGKYYLVADWTQKEGGKLEYGGKTYFAKTSSGTVYLQVVTKNLQKTKRKTTVDKGIKV